MYLTLAKNIINEEYKNKFAIAETPHQKDLMNEKIKHSYQVLGAGNFILKHESCFEKCTPEELSLLKAIVLLHDVARFAEALLFGSKLKFDHGIVGAEILESTKEFNAPEAYLAVRHHGHLIEELYEDKEYQKLSKKKQALTRRNAFLVRDADKIANFYLLAQNFDEIRRIFFSESSLAQAHSKNITATVLNNFMNHQAINKKDVQNFADFALMILAWIYDINYKSSFVFIRKTNIIEKLFSHFSSFFKKRDLLIFKKEINTFIDSALSKK